LHFLTSHCDKHFLTFHKVKLQHDKYFLTSHCDKHFLTFHCDKHFLTSQSDKHFLTSHCDKHFLTLQSDKHFLTLHCDNHFLTSQSDKHFPTSHFKNIDSLPPCDANIKLSYKWTSQCNKHRYIQQHGEYIFTLQCGAHVMKSHYDRHF
jgi:hypothetical protein